MAARRQKLQDVDIIGLDLNMSFSQAEAAVRERMEVARVRAAMESIKAATGFTGTLVEIGSSTNETGSVSGSP